MRRASLSHRRVCSSSVNFFSLGSDMSRFKASDEKVKRAERKFNHLIPLVNGFVRENFYFRTETDTEGHHIIAGIRSPLDPDIAFEVVETVGHLRSALDKMIADVAVANGKGVSGTAFPFGGLGNDGRPEPFPTGRHDGTKKKLTTEQWDLVLAQQPYPGGNDTLWAINTIANADKHGTGLVGVYPTASAGAKISGPMVIGPNGNFERLVFHGTKSAMLGDQAPEAKILTHGLGNKINAEHKMTGFVVFDEIEPVSGLNVLTTLNQQIRLVKRILKVFGATAPMT